MFSCLNASRNIEEECAGAWNHGCSFTKNFILLCKKTCTAIQVISNQIISIKPIFHQWLCSEIHVNYSSMKFRFLCFLIVWQYLCLTVILEIIFLIYNNRFKCDIYFFQQAPNKIRNQNEPLWLPNIAWVLAWALSCCLTSQSKSWKSHWKFPHLTCIECFWLQWFKSNSFVSYWFPQSIQYLWSVKQCFFKSLIENRIRPQNLHLAWPSASFRCTVLIPREFFV